jgi:hypothetical protein
MSEYTPDWTYFEYDTSDLDAAAIALYRFANYIDDEEVLQGAKRIAMDDMERRFDSEIDPFGKKWRHLTPKYEEQKARDGFPVRPILTRTHALRDAATSESAWSVSGESVWFHTDGLPGYWEAHEKGAPSRTYHRDVDGETRESGYYGGLPQRRFIGLSEEAREEILALMGAWLEAGLAQTVAPFKSESIARFGESYRGGIISSMFPGAGGKLQYRVSGKGYGGRFGPMV